MGKSKDISRKTLVRWGTTVVVVGLILICAFYAVNHMITIKRGIAKINDILLPFYIGIIMAYLVTPIYNWVVRHVYKLNQQVLPKHKYDLSIARIFGSIVCVVLIIGVIVAFILTVAPGMWASITGIIPQIEPALNRGYAWVQEHLDQNPEVAQIILKQMDNMGDNALEWIQNTFLPQAGNMVGSITMGVMSVLSTFVDFFIALFICVYILNSKEIFKAQATKVVLALFQPNRAEGIFEFGACVNETFGGFINGKILDSIVIGVLCFFSMTVLNLPLALLVSVIVGCTNIIPFFGPFIGAVPSAILILIIDPIGAVKFLVLVLVLQQLDGNLIGPKILGKSTKLSSFWVMFAIIVAGGLFGVAGMVLGVPVFAIIYTYVARMINGKLENKNIPTHTFVYEDFSKYHVEKDHLIEDADIEVKGEIRAVEDALEMAKADYDEEYVKIYRRD